MYIFQPAACFWFWTRTMYSRLARICYLNSSALYHLSTNHEITRALTSQLTHLHVQEHFLRTPAGFLV